MTQYLTKAEVAERLRVSEKTVDRYIRRGFLKAIKTTDTPQGAVRVTVASYEAYVARQTVTPAGA
ncbi:helix-turn-helix domain-containing protein [Actinomadura sp. KC216]|uniref:helix-turn-helix domain-containing protein n=1 Tax=Actinomadura sp. KC216 TaxID=2530370 RepID=UPI001404A22E|nr:helix-turn-helix domain-containing protein [Actinomadura sp. KC216]